MILKASIDVRQPASDNMHLAATFMEVWAFSNKGGLESVMESDNSFQ